MAAPVGPDKGRVAGTGLVTFGELLAALLADAAGASAVQCSLGAAVGDADAVGGFELGRVAGALAQVLVELCAVSSLALAIVAAGAQLGFGAAVENTLVLGVVKDELLVIGVLGRAAARVVVLVPI